MGFFDADGKRLVTQAVKQAEAKTSAELVVVVRPASARYGHVDGLVGLSTAMAFLCVFLYAPTPFDFTYLPLELAGAFAFGVLCALGVPSLKRALVPRAEMTRAVRSAACETFVERGVHRTRGRSGVLVCVSSFERRVELVTDVGVKAATASREWDAACATLEAAVRRRDVQAFAAGLVSLGAALAGPLPRADDDENELPDAPQEVA